jgi:hypothetical protein
MTERLAGSPERQLVALCSVVNSSTPKQLSDIESLIPHLKNRPDLLRLAYLRKATFETEQGKVADSMDSLKAALKAEQPGSPTCEFENRQLRVAIAIRNDSLCKYAEAAKQARELLAQQSSWASLKTESDTKRNYMFSFLSTNPAGELHRVLVRAALSAHDYKTAMSEARTAYELFRKANMLALSESLLIAEIFEQTERHKQAVNCLEDYGGVCVAALGENKGVLSVHSKIFVEQITPSAANRPLSVEELNRSNALPVLVSCANWFVSHNELELGLKYYQEAIDLGHKYAADSSPHVEEAEQKLKQYRVK